MKTIYNYDNINRVTSIITTKGTAIINTLLYEYDANGNVVSETRNGAETTYTYDSLDRLLSVTYSDGSSVSYEYDALNNRTKETYSNGDVKDYVYDAKYQLKEIKLNGQVIDFLINGEEFKKKQIALPNGIGLSFMSAKQIFHFDLSKFHSNGVRISLKALALNFISGQNISILLYIMV